MQPAAAAPRRLRLSERVGILDAAVAIDAPALDRVHVIGLAGPGLRAARVAQLLVRRLAVAGLVRGAALQDRGCPVPDPRKAEARGGDRQALILRRRQPPVLAAGAPDLHPGHRAP